MIFKDVTAATLFDVVHDTEYRMKWDKDMISMKDICKVCVNNQVGYYAGIMQYQQCVKSTCTITKCTTVNIEIIMLGSFNDLITTLSYTFCIALSCTQTLTISNKMYIIKY